MLSLLQIFFIYIYFIPFSPSSKFPMIKKPIASPKFGNRHNANFSLRDKKSYAPVPRTIVTEAVTK